MNKDKLDLIAREVLRLIHRKAVYESRVAECENRIEDLTHYLTEEQRLELRRIQNLDNIRASKVA